MPPPAPPINKLQFPPPLPMSSGLVIDPYACLVIISVEVQLTAFPGICHDLLHSIVNFALLLPPYDPPPP
jgi:hypothetical protein